MLRLGTRKARSTRYTLPREAPAERQRIPLRHFRERRGKGPPIPYMGVDQLPGPQMTHE